MHSGCALILLRCVCVQMYKMYANVCEQMNVDASASFAHN